MIIMLSDRTKTTTFLNLLTNTNNGRKYTGQTLIVLFFVVFHQDIPTVFSAISLVEAFRYFQLFYC
jgi:hypothetical protein